MSQLRFICITAVAQCMLRCSAAQLSSARLGSACALGLNVCDSSAHNPRPALVLVVVVIVVDLDRIACIAFLDVYMCVCVWVSTCVRCCVRARVMHAT